MSAENDQNWSQYGTCLDTAAAILTREFPDGPMGFVERAWLMLQDHHTAALVVEPLKKP